MLEGSHRCPKVWAPPYAGVVGSLLCTCDNMASSMDECVPGWAVAPRIRGLWSLIGS